MHINLFFHGSLQLLHIIYHWKAVVVIYRTVVFIPLKRGLFWQENKFTDGPLLLSAVSRIPVRKTLNYVDLVHCYANRLLLRVCPLAAHVYMVHCYSQHFHRWSKKQWTTLLWTTTNRRLAAAPCRITTDHVDMVRRNTELFASMKSSTTDQITWSIVTRWNR